MKLAIQKNVQMRSLTLLLFFALALFSTACNKEKEEPEAVLNEEEIVALVEGAMMKSTDGLAAQTESAVVIAEDYAAKTVLGGPCGQTKDSTLTYNFSNAFITAAYSSTLEWTLNCNNAMIPQSLDFNRIGTGTYETARMTSDDNAEGNWLVTNLVTGDNYVFNGMYVRQGSQTSKVRNQNTFTSTLTITGSNLNLSKATRRLASGTASFTLVGSGTGGRSFNYEGSLVFNGNGSVTITVNGQTRTIDLY